MRLLFFSGLLLCCFSFKTRERRPVYLFRNSGFYRDFFMRVDNSFIYNERNKYVGNGAYGLLMGKYWTAKETIKIQLKIDGKDTSLIYDLSKCKCDSLMIGRNDNSFVILNEHQYPWFND